MWNAWRPPSRRKSAYHQLARADDKKFDSSPVPKSEDAVVTAVSHKTKVSAKPVIAVTDENGASLSPSVPPVRSTLKLSAADQAKLASRVLK
jgi:hypothetical protein